MKQSIEKYKTTDNSNVDEFILKTYHCAKTRANRENSVHWTSTQWSSKSGLYQQNVL